MTKCRSVPAVRCPVAWLLAAALLVLLAGGCALGIRRDASPPPEVDPNAAMCGVEAPDVPAVAADGCLVLPATPATPPAPGPALPRPGALPAGPQPAGPTDPTPTPTATPTPTPASP